MYCQYKLYFTYVMKFDKYSYVLCSMEQAGFMLFQVKDKYVHMHYVYKIFLDKSNCLGISKIHNHTLIKHSLYNRSLMKRNLIKHKMYQ